MPKRTLVAIMAWLLSKKKVPHGAGARDNCFYPLAGGGDIPVQAPLYLILSADDCYLLASNPSQFPTDQNSPQAEENKKVKSTWLPGIPSGEKYADIVPVSKNVEENEEE